MKPRFCALDHIPAVDAVRAFRKSWLASEALGESTTNGFPSSKTTAHPNSVLESLAATDANNSETNTTRLGLIDLRIRVATREICCASNDSREGPSDWTDSSGHSSTCVSKNPPLWNSLKTTSVDFPAGEIPTASSNRPASP